MTSSVMKNASSTLLSSLKSSPDRSSGTAKNFSTPTMQNIAGKENDSSGARSKERLKDLYLQRLKNLSPGNDSINISNSDQSDSIAHISPAKPQSVNPRDESSPKEDAFASYLKATPPEVSSVKGRFEQFVSRHSSPEKQATVPPLDLLAFSKQIAGAKSVINPDNKFISQMSVDELLTIVSKRSSKTTQPQSKRRDTQLDTLSTVGRDPGAANLLEDSMTFQFEQMRNATGSGSRSPPHNNIREYEGNVVGMVPIVEHQTTYRTPNSNRATVKKESRGRQSSDDPKNHEKPTPKREDSRTSRSDFRNTSGSPTPLEIAELEVQLKGKDHTIESLKREIKKAIEMLKKEQDLRTKEKKTNLAEINKVVEEKNKLQKEIDALKERLAIYDKANGTTEISRMKKDINHNVNLLKCREITLLEQIEQLEKSLKSEKDKVVQLNKEVLDWKTKCTNDNRGLLYEKLKVKAKKLEESLRQELEIANKKLKSFEGGLEIQKLKIENKHLTEKVEELIDLVREVDKQKGSAVAEANSIKEENETLRANLNQVVMALKQAETDLEKAKKAEEKFKMSLELKQRESKEQSVASIEKLKELEVKAQQETKTIEIEYSIAVEEFDKQKKLLDDMQNALEDTQNVLKDTENTLKQTQDAMKELEVKCQELERALNEKESQILELNAALQEARSSSIKAGFTSEKSVEKSAEKPVEMPDNAKFEEMQQQLNEEVQKREAAQKREEELQGQLEMAQKEMEKLREEISKAAKELSHGPEKPNQEKPDEVGLKRSAELEPEKQEILQALEEMKNENSILKKEVDVAMAERERLLGLLENLDSETAAKEQLSREVENYKNMISESMAQIEKLTAEHQELLKKFNELQSNENTEPSQNNNAVEIENLKQEIQDCLNKIQNRDDKIIELVTTNEETQARVDELTALLKKAQEEAKNVNITNIDPEMVINKEIINALELKIGEKDTQIEQLQNELLKLKASIEEARTESHEAKANELKELQMTIQTLQDQLASQKRAESEQIKQLTTEISTVITENQIKIQKLEETKRNLEEQNLQLSHNLNESQIKVSTLEVDIISLQEFVSSMKAMQENSDEETRQNLLEANETIVQLKNELSKAKSEEAAMLLEKNEEIRKITEEFTTLENLLHNMEMAKQEEVSALNDELISNQQRIKELSDALNLKEKNFANEIEELRANLTLANQEQAAKFDEERQTLVDQLKILDQQIEGLNSELTELKLQSGRENELLEKLKRAEEEVQHLTSVIVQQQSSYDDSRAASSSMQRALEERVAELEDTNSKLLEEKERLESLHASDVTRLSEAIKNHEETIRSLKESSTSDQETIRLEKMQLEAKITQLNSQITSLEEEKESLLTKLTTANSENEQVQRELQDSKERVNSLEQEMEQSRLISDHLLEEKVAQINDLTSELEREREKVTSLEQELSQTATKLQEEREKNNSLTKEMQYTVSETTSLTGEQLTQAESTISELQAQVAALMKDAAAGEEAVKQVEHLKTTIKELEAAKRELQQENEELKVKAEANNSEITMLKQQKYDSRNIHRTEENTVIARLKEEAKLREEQIEHLEKANKEVKNHYEALLKTANDRIANYQVEMNKLLSAGKGISQDRKTQLKIQEFEGMNVMLQQQLSHFGFMFEDQEARFRDNEKQTKILAKKMQETEESYEALKQQHEETTEELEGLKNTLDSQKKLMKKYQDHNKELMTEKDNLHNQISDLETALAHYKDAMSKYIVQIEQANKNELEAKKENELLKKKKSWKLFSK